MLQDSLFKTGKLLLETTPPEASAPAAEPSAWLLNLLLVVFVVLGIATLKRFLQVLPYMADSYLRVRGSAALEGSIRVSQDRNLVALVLTIPAVLLVYRYKLYNPELFQELDPNFRLAGVALVLLAYSLLRHFFYLWLRPRRRIDTFRQAHRVGYTYFILLMSVLLVTVGLLSLIGLDETIVRWVLYGLTGFIFLLFLFRCAQILSLSCNPLRTFLYLCALEILPAGLLVVSALVL
jgi:hypothetical protein